MNGGIPSQNLIANFEYNMALTFTPFQHTIQVTIDDKTIDYLLTVDETGHVYEAKPMIFELPGVIQKLILGKDDGQMERKVLAFTDLLKYIVPLSLANQLSIYQASLASLLQEINQRLECKNTNWSDLKFNYDSSSVASNIHSVFSTNRTPSKHAEKLWEYISHVINQHQKGGQITRQLEQLSKYYSYIIEDFFPAIIPFFNYPFQRFAFECMQYVKSLKTKNYLLKELEMPFSNAYATGILTALKGYYIGGQDVYEAALRYYDRIDKQNDNLLCRIIELLTEYPSVKTIEVGFDILNSTNRYGAKSAAKALLEMGIEPQKIVDSILPSFKTADPIISAVPMYIFNENEALIKHLPSAQEILDIFITIFSKDRHSSIAYSIPTFAFKTGVYELPEHIAKMLQHESSGVQYGALFLLSKSFKFDTVDIRPFITEKMLDRYFELAQNGVTCTLSLNLIGRIGWGTKRADFIDRLLKIYEGYRKNSRSRLRIIGTINHILRSVPYQSQIEPIYLEALEAEVRRGNERALALNGLRFSPDEAFKKTLLKYKQDPDRNVREAVKYLFNPPKEDRRFTHKEKNESWNNIIMFPDSPL